MLDIDPLRGGTPAVPAATVVLVRGGERALEVLLVQRHKATAFMGGAHVFPGGKLDPHDADANLRERVDAPADEDLLRSLGPSEDIDALTARALRIAAARETFEEAGILLGRTVADERALIEARAHLNAKAAFDEVLRSIDATLSLGRLVPLSRWITPVVERRRFDARFFLTEVSYEESERASEEHHETVASRWLAPRHAIELHLEGAIDLPPPTLRTLELLALDESASAALLRARSSPPPLVRPVFRTPDEGWVLALPGDPLHPEERAVIAGSTRFVCREGRWYSA